MERFPKYSQRFIFSGEYIFGKQSYDTNLEPSKLTFSPVPFRQIRYSMLDTVCCYIPVSLIHADEPHGYLDNIALHPRFDLLKSYFTQHLLVGNPAEMVDEAIMEILRVYAQMDRSREIMQRTAKVKRLTGDAIAQYAEIRWLLDTSWHPYYVAPLCAENPVRFLVDYEDRDELGLLRPDLIAGKCERTFLLELLFQITRYLYIKLRFPKESLSDVIIMQDRVYLQENADSALACCRAFLNAIPHAFPSPEALYTRFMDLLHMQTTLDDDPVNLHHDADVVAAMHLLRMEMDMAIGIPVSWSLEIKPEIDTLCEKMTPGIWAFYQQSFLPKLAQQTNTQAIWS